MLTYEQALQEILKQAHSLPARNIPIEDAVERVLAEDIFSQIDMPPFDKSAMDGYALRSSDTANVPVQLRCLGTIQAGRFFKQSFKSGCCIKIMTGAPMPQGADSVVMVEDTEQHESRVIVKRSVKPGENVCAKAEDIAKGSKVFSKGKLISISDIALIATIGRRLVKTISSPSVAVLNTGGEIIPVGRKLPKNKIYNSNGPQLCALLRLDGITPRYLGIAKDEPAILKKMISQGLKSDIVLISGGVSMGDYDLVPAVLKQLGVKELFHKVNIKPGKPLFFGVKNRRLIFGIPGNPVSNFLAYQIFIRPAIRKMMGLEDCNLEIKTGILENEFRQKPGRKHFVLAKVEKLKNVDYVSALPGHGSADIAALSAADAFMLVDGEISKIKQGSKVEFITWRKI
jgi:molybdopterin molybdotransferase